MRWKRGSKSKAVITLGRNERALWDSNTIGQARERDAARRQVKDLVRELMVRGFSRVEVEAPASAGNFLIEVYGQ